MLGTEHDDHPAASAWQHWAYHACTLAEFFVLVMMFIVFLWVTVGRLIIVIWYKGQITKTIQRMLDISKIIATILVGIAFCIGVFAPLIFPLHMYFLTTYGSIEVFKFMHYTNDFLSANLHRCFFCKFHPSSAALANPSIPFPTNSGTVSTTIRELQAIMQQFPEEMEYLRSLVDEDSWYQQKVTKFYNARDARYAPYLADDPDSNDIDPLHIRLREAGKKLREFLRERRAQGK